MAGYRRWWRVTLTWQSGMYSPARQPEQVIEVYTVAQLRAIVLGARANPRIENYVYRRARAWVDSALDGGRAPRCRRGHELPPARYGVTDCCCPVGGHMHTRCSCGDEMYVPDLGLGCGPVPIDPEAGKHLW